MAAHLTWSGSAFDDRGLLIAHYFAASKRAIWRWVRGLLGCVHAYVQGPNGERESWSRNEAGAWSATRRAAQAATAEEGA